MSNEIDELMDIIDDQAMTIAALQEDNDRLRKQLDVLVIQDLQREAREEIESAHMDRREWE